jgi:hypothetical protein
MRRFLKVRRSLGRRTFEIKVGVMLPDQQDFQPNLFGTFCLPFVRSNKL